MYDPAHRTFWFTYGWPDGDAKSSNPSFDGANKNTWGAWIPFVISEMTEEGYYTDWNGNITPMGARYLAASERKTHALTLRRARSPARVNMQALLRRGGGPSCPRLEWHKRAVSRRSTQGGRVTVNRAARCAQRGLRADRSVGLASGRRNAPAFALRTPSATRPRPV